jgi:uncharacterized protein YigA (DUF484 family)
MSVVMSENNKTSDLSKTEIIEWLRANPDFLSDNPEVCDFLTPPLSVSGKGLADFQAYMIKRLKDDKDEVIESAREIVETTRVNMNNQVRIHKAVLMVLEAVNFEDFIRTITLDFAALLDIDIISLVVEADGEVVPHINMPGVRLMTPGTVALLMKEHDVVLESNIMGLEEIYGGGAGLVKSQTLLRLHIGGDTPPALLAFGSRDPDLFQPGQGTEQILFLGRVVERCFKSWLSS